jgi:predicted RNA binding protein YcfA (HicA-like mRNA interferase family)
MGTFVALISRSRSCHWCEMGFVCIIHTMQSRELIKLLQAHGWRLQRTRGSHHQFIHPTKVGTITVPHPKKDLGKGLVLAILKQAGLK